jgi:hypothetical protein
LIPKGERSGLFTRIAATGKRLVVNAEEKLTAFLQLEAECRRLFDCNVEATTPRKTRAAFWR